MMPLLTQGKMGQRPSSFPFLVSNDHLNYLSPLTNYNKMPVIWLNQTLVKCLSSQDPEHDPEHELPLRLNKHWNLERILHYDLHCSTVQSKHVLISSTTLVSFWFTPLPKRQSLFCLISGFLCRPHGLSFLPTSVAPFHYCNTFFLNKVLPKSRYLTLCCLLIYLLIPI